MDEFSALSGRCHHGGASKKVNDLVAFRSTDQAQSWERPTVLIDICYNLHGFVPFTSKLDVESHRRRMYFFGTQPADQPALPLRREILQER